MTDRAPRHMKLKIAAVSIAAVLLVAAAAFFVYVGDFYRADYTAQQAAADDGAYAEDGVRVEHVAGKMAFVPAKPVAGLIFYPGGKVEAQAYAPLMQQLARDGVLCVICPMPFNLAIFDINAADGAKALFPEVEKWYIGGHSLGGSMAAMYLDGHSDAFDGLVLLGSYSTSNLGDDEVEVISIRGSEDRIMNADKQRDNAKNIPQAKDVVIEGGNHGQFGSYGQQDGDGTATISPEAQWAQTASEIAEWIKGR